MRALPGLALATFLLGVALILAAVALGQGEIFLFLIFPGIMSDSPLAFVGFLLIFLSFILGFLGFLQVAPQAEAPKPALPRTPSEFPPSESAPTVTGQTRKGFGGMVFVGPIPIVFGSDRRITALMLILGLAIAIILFVILVL